MEQAVSDTNWTLQAFLLQVQNMSQLHAEADATQAHLEQRMIELQTKMLQLEQAAQRLNTPMNFDGNTTAILEPPARRKPVFSSIEMDAREPRAYGARGRLNQWEEPPIQNPGYWQWRTFSS
ncbi:hypothetical protein Bbelb_308910 [Branchiostoma belcheri]|nr:hypothetical protein Bbelb_308910 [Branchiostoma belcheri]